MVRKLLARPLLSLPSGRCSSDPGRLYPSGCQSDPYCSEVSTSDSEIQLKGMACSIDIQPEFVPSVFCSDYTCDQLADLLASEKALDDLWRAQGFPTPPSTPERGYCPSDDLEEDSESDSNMDFPMLNELILLAYGEEVLTSSPVPFPLTTNLQDKLIQDCMWSGHICDRVPHSKKHPPAPLNLPPVKIPSDRGVYTPAPSPLTPPSASGGESSQEGEIEAMESDCISPSVVFPSFIAAPATKHVPAVKESRTPVTVEDGSTDIDKGNQGSSSDPDWESSEEYTCRRSYEREHSRKSERKLSTAAVGTGGNTRHQPQSELSTSDEEIDVVTVPSSERTRLARKRSHPLSAPCSRQPSPHPPPKRRKYHTKRLQRLSSAGSSGCDIAESDDEARRASHNVLERKRRNDLKSSFQRLREEIPELEDNQRAPKVTILRKATDYIRQMQETKQSEEQELAAEKRRYAQLIDRLKKLKSSQI